MSQVGCVFSFDHAEDVDDLRHVVRDAWTACLHEYLQVITMRLVDPQYSQRFFNSTFHDIYEFYFFSKELDTKSMGNWQVWRAWRYIRPLVVKYVLKSDKEKQEIIKRLDHGYACDVFALCFRCSLILGRPPKAAADMAGQRVKFPNANGTR